MKKYIVLSSNDYQEYGTFETLKEAEQFIKELKRFDEEHGNPFNEGYFVEEEEDLK